MDHDDVTQWLHKLGEGDEEAAQAIWERYFKKLVRLARKRLEGLPRRTADEEDVALSAMNSFYRGMAAGRFPQLKDRQDLWKLLVTITAHKAVAQSRRHRARKRGEGKIRGESAGRIDQVMGKEPTPGFACMVAENCRVLLEQLDDETLKAIALFKMEGYTNQEIAKKLGYTARTVGRKLMRIRKRWERAEP